MIEYVHIHGVRSIYKLYYQCKYLNSWSWTASCNDMWIWFIFQFSFKHTRFFISCIIISLSKIWLFQMNFIFVQIFRESYAKYRNSWIRRPVLQPFKVWIGSACNKSYGELQIQSTTYYKTRVTWFLHSLALEGCNPHEIVLVREWYFLIGIPMGHSG